MSYLRLLIKQLRKENGNKYLNRIDCIPYCSYIKIIIICKSLLQNKMTVEGLKFIKNRLYSKSKKNCLHDR